MVPASTAGKRRPPRPQSSGYLSRAAKDAATIGAAAILWMVAAVGPAADAANFTARTFDGVGNNELNPECGALPEPPR